MIPFSDDELFSAVAGVIEKIRPSLALDGGGIELLGVKSGRVYVQLQGACVGCASSHETLKYGVERQIRIEIHPEIEVVNVPFGMEDRWDQIG